MKDTQKSNVDKKDNKKKKWEVRSKYVWYSYTNSYRQ